MRTITKDEIMAMVAAKNCRPTTARQSFAAAIAYAFLTHLPEAGLQLGPLLVEPWQFNVEVLLALLSPILAYSGLRSIDKRKSKAP